jgi:salicylate hydroxylase
MGDCILSDWLLVRDSISRSRQNPEVAIAMTIKPKTPEKMEIKQVTNPVVEKVAIVGAGPGGLATAIALRNQGIDAQVYERAKAFRPVGAGLALTPNGLNCLDAISPGIVEELKRASCQFRRHILKKYSGETIETKPAQYMEQYGQPALLFWWWRLQQVLMSALPPEAIHLDYDCTGFEQDEKGAIAYFNHGKSVRADLLVGADGIHSAVRQTLVGDGTLRYLGSTCLRAVLKYSDERLHPDELIVLKSEKEKLLILDVGDGYKCWTAYLLMPEDSLPENAAKIKSALVARLTDWWEPARAIVTATDPESILFAPICDRPPLKSWSQGRVTLLGDAAHPMATAAGQGVNTTFEDAYELAQCLATSPTIESALTTYENRRIPRTEAIQAHSAMAEKKSYSANRETGDREIAQQEQIAVEQFLDWVYRYDPKSESRFQPWIETSVR